MASTRGLFPAAAEHRVIDVHTHAMPMPTLRYLADRGLAELSKVSAGTVYIATEVSGVREGTAIPCPPQQYDLDARLAAMAAAGVDHQLISPPPFFFGSLAGDVPLVHDVVEMVNDTLVEHVSDYKGQLSALGVIPVGTACGADEAKRCLDELGMVGVTIGTFGGGRELDDPINEGLWSVLAERSAPVVVHPSRVSSPERVGEYWLTQLFGFPVETGLAAARLVFGGVLERHGVTFILAHGGGCLASVRGRLDKGWNAKPQARTTDLPPSALMRNFYYDSCVFDTAALRGLVETCGASKVLLGSDFPFDLCDPTPVESVRALGLAPAEEAAVLGGNAAMLLAGAARAGVPTGSAD
ncbi:MAG: amidohydrolase family protein [Propionibacteriales bacterium]|nr:amidohydrolase family protein [Propionibacteriales bacterium]